MVFFFSSRRRHTRYWRDWSSDVCSSDLDDGLQRDLHLPDAQPSAILLGAAVGGEVEDEITNGADVGKQTRIGGGALWAGGLALGGRLSGSGVGGRGERSAKLLHERDGVPDRLGDRVLSCFGPRGRIVLRAGSGRDEEDGSHTESEDAHG